MSNQQPDLFTCFKMNRSHKLHARWCISKSKELQGTGAHLTPEYHEINNSWAFRPFMSDTKETPWGTSCVREQGCHLSLPYFITSLLKRWYDLNYPVRAVIHSVPSLVCGFFSNDWCYHEPQGHFRDFMILDYVQPEYNNTHYRLMLAYTVEPLA